MNKRDAFCLFGLAAVLLFTTVSLSAQAPTPVEIANEVMLYEQSAALSYIGVTFGTDAASPLNFSTHIDPAGQSFSFSLNAGSTYLGKPLSLTTSGALDHYHVWRVTSSASFGGVPWTETGTYVPPSASGYGSRRDPCYNGCLANVYFDAMWGYTPVCCFFAPSLACETIASWTTSAGTYDKEYCYLVDPLNHGQPVEGSAYYAYSFHLLTGDSLPWTWSGANLQANYWGAVDSSGTSFTDGSPGSSTSVLSPITVSTTSYFNDFGSGESTYQCCTGLPVSGSGGGGNSFTTANQFTAAASGSVSKVDFGVSYVSGTDTFYAALYTDNGGLPGTQLGRWDNLASNLFAGQCCGKVTVSGVSGISLTAGQSYFMVLGPEHVTDTTSLTWNTNTQGVSGLDLYSNDGGSSWNSNGQQSLGSFDILSQPAGIMTNANQFTAAASGSVGQIDVAVAYVSGANSFYAAVYTSNGGVPGTQLARWDNLSSSQSYQQCCGLVSITGIAGLNLIAGNQYFLVVGPESLESSTVEQWNLNITGAQGLNLYSLDGGNTWNQRRQAVLSAFDLVGEGTFYSNLGTGTSVYQCCSAYQVSGGTLGAQSLLASRQK